MNGVVRARRVVGGKRRTRSVQTLLSLRDPEPSEGPAVPAPAVPAGPPACRAALAHWPVEWRERWGVLANALEEAGLPWREAESRAFLEVWALRRAESKTQAISPVATEPGRN